MIDLLPSPGLNISVPDSSCHHRSADARLQRDRHLTSGFFNSARAWGAGLGQLRACWWNQAHAAGGRGVKVQLARWLGANVGLGRGCNTASRTPARVVVPATGQCRGVMADPSPHPGLADVGNYNSVGQRWGLI